MNIFLSYASEQRELAEALCLGLRGDGHEVFFDRESLPASGNYIARISAEIERADLFVFLVSPESVTVGRYTLSELDVARRKWPHPRGHVLPVKVAPTPMAVVPVYLKAVTVLEPQGNVVADVIHAVQFDVQKALSEDSGSHHGHGGPSSNRGRAAWSRALAAGIAVPVVMFAAAVLLVRMDVLRADNLNYVPPVGLMAGLAAAAWIVRRRG